MSFVEGKLENARVYDGKVFPRTYLPSDETKRTPTDLAESIADERRSLLTSLDKHGALLFRGFGVNSVSDFTGIVEAFGWEEHPYEGASNRVKVADRIFTASEAPLNEFIPFHHEMAMIKSSCSKIFFMCMTPASFGGETSIVRSDVVVEEMEKAEPEAVAKFNEVGMIANIHAKITTKSGNDDSTAGRKLWHRMLKTTDEEEGRTRFHSSSSPFLPNLILLISLRREGKAKLGSMSSGNPSLLVIVTVSVSVAIICSLHIYLVDAVKPFPRSKSDSSMIIKDEIVRYVNGNHRAGWQAVASPRFANYTVGQFKHILGVKPMPQNSVANLAKKTFPRNLDLPKEFDARKAWSHCSTIGDILDQGHCGSCWAFGAVESLSDRFCIHFNMSVALSVNDLLSCCGFMCGDGCDGGWPYKAWQYLAKNGVVTSECDPYFDDVGCSHPGCEPTYPTPRCEKKCQAKNQIWQDSKHYSVNAYYVDSDPYNIMAEVYKNGPVEVDFTVYEDFAHYKSGVYRHITGEAVGGHAVKLIGWGTSADGEDYWLLANQWNRGWGDDGYFKMARGRNECGIEGDVVAGLPSSKNLIKKYAGDGDGDAAI